MSTEIVVRGNGWDAVLESPLLAGDATKAARRMRSLGFEATARNGVCYVNAKAGKVPEWVGEKYGGELVFSTEDPSSQKGP